MGRSVPWLNDRVRRFVIAYWDTDVREDDTSAFARNDMRKESIYDEMRSFLLDVIQRDAVTPEEWARLCNVHVRTRADVQEDARDFWDWLFDEEPLVPTENPNRPRS